MRWQNGTAVAILDRSIRMARGGGEASHVAKCELAVQPVGLAKRSVGQSGVFEKLSNEREISVGYPLLANRPVGARTTRHSLLFFTEDHKRGKVQYAFRWYRDGLLADTFLVTPLAFAE